MEEFGRIGGKAKDEVTFPTEESTDNFGGMAMVEGKPLRLSTLSHCDFRLLANSAEKVLLSKEKLLLINGNTVDARARSKEVSFPLAIEASRPLAIVMGIGTEQGFRAKFPTMVTSFHSPDYCGFEVQWKDSRTGRLEFLCDSRDGGKGWPSKKAIAGAEVARSCTDRFNRFGKTFPTGKTIDHVAGIPATFYECTDNVCH